MMISNYQMQVGESTQFDAPLHAADPDASVTLRIPLDDEAEGFEQPAAIEEVAPILAGSRRFGKALPAGNWLGSSAHARPGS